MTVDEATVADWMRRYVEAWASNDRADIEALFTDDATYHAEPYGDPYLGASAIADAWLYEPDDPSRWRADYAPFLATGDVGVATGTSSYFDGEGNVDRV